MEEQTRSLGFRIKKWQYNPALPTKNLYTDAQMLIYALKDSEKNNEIAGMALGWILVISSDGTEVSYFSAEEMFVVPNKNISEEEIQTLINTSYIMAYGEATIKNKSIGITASFPALDKIKYDIEDVKKIFKS